MAEAGPTLKRLSLELGGKCPAIIFADANLDEALPAVVLMANLFAGQFCMQASRVLVEKKRADEVRDRLIRMLGGTKVGPASDPDSRMGPLINTTERDRVAGIVERASNEGEVVLRGTIPDGPGAFLTPSLVEVADTGTTLVQDELFGPITTFEVFEDDDEAAAKANATRYGLAASVWTSDSRRPLSFGRRLKSGTVWTNAHGLILDQFEEGGFRDSGLGRLNGPGGVESFLEVKHYLSPGAP
jgi:acyl-CoA reductase-like NAD-dependent aldehyde dehydrogenase